MPNTRGSRSFRPLVRAISKLGKPCSQLKNHFEYESSYRTVIGYAERLALEDSERFIWVSRWKQMLDDSGKKKRQLYNCLAFFEQHGLLTPARRFRNKAWRHGWIVVDHAQSSEVVNQICCLKLIDNPLPAPRTKGQRRSLSAFETAPSAFEKNPSAFLSAFESAFEIGPECISDSGNSITDTSLQTVPEKAEVTSPSQPYKPLDESPFKRALQTENQHLDQSPLSFSESKADENQNPRASDGLTVSDVLENADVVRLSDGEFDSRFLSLAGYPYTTELQDCIQQVISESLSDSYLGRPTNIFLMREVMTRLKKESGLSVPRGWLPIMDKLKRDSVVRICRPFEPPPNLEQVAELRELLIGQEAPHWYLQNGFITETECQELCLLSRKDYDEHPEFWGLIAAESEYKMQNALATYREAVNV